MSKTRYAQVGLGDRSILFTWAITQQYAEISECNNLSLETLSGFLISLNEINKDTIWFEFINKNVMSRTIYPPILLLKLDKKNLASETYVRDQVEEYSSKIIEFITNATKSVN